MLIPSALRLPAPDIEALVQGRTIAAIPQIFLNPGRLFALYPSDASIISLPTERYYRSNFLTIAQKSFTDLNSQTVSIKAWARCEFCRDVKDAQALAAIAGLTVWTEEALQKILSQRGNIFLAYLRVYQLIETIEIAINTSQNLFVPLPQPLAIAQASSVLSEAIFNERKRQLENRETPWHSELEELQSAIAQLNHPDARLLADKISRFLGWASNPSAKPLPLKLNWIYTINSLGIATTGGNYEKGDAFEKIVRKSLVFLGFDIDPNAKGGAGGMDLYCIKPYPLVGECKAGQGMPDATSEELIRIGRRHLGKDIFEEAVKLIIGPGQPKKQILATAQEFKISIINPMTLEKLVELQAKYPGSVNLIELKPYLAAGQIDSRIEEYIKKVEKEIKLRSQIVLAVKQLAERNRDRVTATEVCIQYTGSMLTDDQVHELLIELSSPLTGYLGREKKNGIDRFYFLRDLIIENL